MKHPTVSLCMIVRDEQDSLPAALESVGELVDEIIVCDTGSVDGTVACAEDLGARVIHFPWCDDFAAARNAALDAAGSEWVLVLDADEVLAPVDPGELLALLADPSAAGYEVTIRSRRPGEDQDFPVVRLFRNDHGVRYRFPIHEQIVPALNAWAAGRGLRVMPSPLVILHQGYTPEKRAAKRPRNRRLLEKAVAEFPDEPYLRFQLGAEGTALLDGEVLPTEGMTEALANLELAWSLTAALDNGKKKSRPWLADLTALLGSARLVSGNAVGAREVLVTGERLFPGDERVVFLAGLAALEQENPPAAEIQRRAGSLPPLDRLRLLGELNRRLGEFEAAQAHFQQASSLSADYSPAFAGLAGCLRDQGRRQEALAWYLKAVSASEWNWRAWLDGAALLADLGLAEEAARWRATFVRHFPDHPLTGQLSSSS